MADNTCKLEFGEGGMFFFITVTGLGGEFIEDVTVRACSVSGINVTSCINGDYSIGIIMDGGASKTFDGLSEASAKDLYASVNLAIGAAG